MWGGTDTFHVFASQLEFEVKVVTAHGTRAPPSMVALKISRIPSLLNFGIEDNNRHKDCHTDMRQVGPYP